MDGEENEGSAKKNESRTPVDLCLCGCLVVGEAVIEEVIWRILYSKKMSTFD